MDIKDGKLDRNSTVSDVFGFVFNSPDGFLSVVLPLVNLLVILYFSSVDVAGLKFVPALFVMFIVHFSSFVYMRVNRVNKFGVLINCLNQFVMASIPWVWVVKSGYLDKF